MLKTLDMEAFTPIVEHYLTIEDEVPAEQRVPMSGVFADSFKFKAAVMRQYVHERRWETKRLKELGIGSAALSLPSTKELSDLHRVANRAGACVRIVDLPWLTQYLSTVSAQHKHMIQVAILSVGQPEG